LSATQIHEGELSPGHHFLLKRINLDDDTPRWIEFNESLVKEVSDKYVMDTARGQINPLGCLIVPCTATYSVYYTKSLLRPPVRGMAINLPEDFLENDMPKMNIEKADA
jgi:hypothetical protein